MPGVIILSHKHNLRQNRTETMPTRPADVEEPKALLFQGGIAWEYSDALAHAGN